ncbi:MAG TPA: hypothetical protein VFH47_08895, partial [Candidatus Thermoplasmatota archaeon]|nr:hypothetical protein [Candidatus Thermoplasmatota archaeon]
VVLYVRGWLSLWLYETFVETFVLVACIGLWALLCYLIFTYSGKRTWWWPLGWFYGAMYAFVIGVMHHAGPPEALELVAGRVRPVGVQPLPALTNLAIFLFLLGPQVVAAAAYAFLYTKAQTRTQRYRILLVSGGLLAWLGFVLLRGVAQAEGVGWRLLGQGVGLVAALLVLLAYFPPALLQRRWGLDTIGGDARAASG